MKIKIYTFFVIGCLIQSCNSGFTVKGTIDNMPVQNFKIEELGIDNNITIDSGISKQDGTFQIKSKATEEALYRIKFEKGKYILLALKKGDNAKITAKWNQLENYQVTGSHGSTVLKSFLVNLRENIRDIETIQIILDSIKTRPKNDSLKKEAIKDLQNINSKFMNYVKNFADTTKSVSNALFAVNIINPTYHQEYINTFYKNLNSRFPDSKNAKLFSEKYLNLNTIVPNDKVENKNSAPDFTGTSPDGKQIMLSSFKGKYVLLDFWASWCAPCRKASEALVKMINENKEKNIAAIGISLDSNKEKWVEAIQKDNLNWTHVSELNGWANTIARNYNVKSIPNFILVDPNGHIIANESNIASMAQIIKNTLK